jgi:hypothetical protein
MNTAVRAGGKGDDRKQNKLHKGDDRKQNKLHKGDDRKQINCTVGAESALRNKFSL